MPDNEAIINNLVKSYQDLYNEDLDRFVSEVYTEDCVVHCMGGPTIRGRADLLAVEKVILEAAPQRRMKVTRHHIAADAVVVEAVLEDPAQGPDWNLPFVAIFNCSNGLVAVDRSYAEWPRWPGL